VRLGPVFPNTENWPNPTDDRQERYMFPHKSILIVTDMDDDLHAAVVVDELKKRGERVVCLDPRKLIEGEVSFSIAENTFANLCPPQDAFSAEDIKSVLYRRPSVIPEDQRVNEEYRPFVRKEWLSVIAGLWEVLEDHGALMVSNPSHIQRAEIKLRQLYVARELGFRLPRTLVTNSVAQVSAFFADQNSILAMKKLRSHSIVAGEHSALFVTTLLKDIDQLEKANLSLCPAVFQEFIPKQFDVRLIVVGARVFAFKIHSQSNDETKIDYRAGKEKTQDLFHEQYEPPPELVDKCLKMLQRFELRFGAFDFVINQDNEHVFLELNPNGQWLWLQLKTGANIVEAFCDLLSRSPIPNRHVMT
jgi:glutathione synthase/RimK-type ligase-like ATP-grasp enzyme